MEVVDKLKMKVLCVFAVLLVSVCAQEWYGHGGGSDEPNMFFDNSEYQYTLEQLRMDGRAKRDISGSLPAGDNGKLVGTLGNTANGGLYGTGGYEYTLVNNNGGRLAAQAYGTRLLNPNRDSTYYGGKLNWQDSNMQASVDARQRLGGRTRMVMKAGGRWEPYRNSELTAEGHYSKREGRPSDYGGIVKFGYRLSSLL